MATYRTKLTATLLSLGLLVASVSSPASDATPAVSAQPEAKPLNQPGQSTQAPAATVTQLRLRLEGVLDEKSQTLKGGEYYQIHTFEGKIGEKLTLNLSSQDFDAGLVVFGVDRKPLARDNDSGSGTNARLEIKLPATGTYFALVTSAEEKAIGQYQLEIWDEAYQNAVLEEIKPLDAQVRRYFQQRRFDEAIPLAERAIAIQRRMLGRSFTVSQSLNVLAILYETQKRYGEAEALLKEAFAIDKALFGKQHMLFRTTLDSLAELYANQGRYAKAEALYKEALTESIAFGSNVTVTIGSSKAPLYILDSRYEQLTGSLAALYKRQGRNEESEAVLREFLTQRRATLGNQNNPFVARSLNDLASLYMERWRYGEAEPLFKEALAMRQAFYGQRPNEEVATSLSNLGRLYSLQGRYGEGERLLKEALAMRTALQGNRPEDVVSDELAWLYSKQGRSQEAKALNEQILAIRKAALGDRHEDVATSLSNLAVLYRVQGRYQEAEALHKEALVIRRKLLGNRHQDVAQSLNNLAVLYTSQNRYAEAEALLKEALDVRKAVLGDRHPLLASSLYNLALLYESQDRLQQAEPLLKQALSTNKSFLGDRHPDLALYLSGLANLYMRQGNVRQVIDLYTESFAIQETHLATNLAFGAEAQKRQFITTLSRIDAAVSLHLQLAPNNLNATQLALTTVLQRKGRILDALTDNLTRLRQNLAPVDQQKLDQLSTTRTQLAALYYGGLGTLTPEQSKDRIMQLQGQVTRLEADLNNRSTEFRTATQPITLEAVQAQIPANAALVELVRYEPFNPKAKAAERWGKPRYAAYTLTASGTIHAIDLGEAAPIDQLAEDFRQALRSRESSVKPIARKLDAALMQPIRAKLGNTRNLLISPDSQLNLIPFAALVDEQNRYLVETYSINYLTSGGDLLRLQNPVASRQPPVLIANPDYANPGNPQSIARLQSGKSTAIVASSSPRPRLGEGQGVRAANRRSADLARLQFTPLPGTAAEADAIAPKLPNVTLLTGTNATENALKQVQSPKILHIATHGFFLEDVPPVAAGTRGAGFLLRSDILPNVEAGFRPPARPGNTENALVRSGLALAGFNPRQSGEEDGVLTALEAAGLDLRGTQLVVLSACETGVGDVANGEGVYGLRRAFVMAGAESQLISLWKVDDNGTKELMVKYYDKLLAKAGRSEALRQTQLEFLKNPNYNHPYYWAAFIPSGDWRAIRD